MFNPWLGTFGRRKVVGCKVLFQGVARRIIGLHILATHALELILRGVELAVGDQDDADIVAIFHIGNVLALFIQQVGRDVDRQLGRYPPGVFLEGFFLDDPKDGQGERIDTADITVPGSR